MYADNLRIVRMKQQQENERFLSHFDGEFFEFCLHMNLSKNFQKNIGFFD